jgi:four helix bundle protein
VSRKPRKDVLADSTYRDQWASAAHERLDVYRVSRSVVSDVYRETSGFPDHERFGLTSQIRRAAVSIPANIAEGASRGSRKELSRSLMVARGSASELVVLLEIAEELGYLSRDCCEDIRENVRRVSAMSSGLIRRLRPARAESER